MSNSARDLHILYSSWRDRFASKTSTAKGALEPHTAKGAQEFVQAFRLLGRIDVLLRQLEQDGYNVSLYRRQFPKWSAGVLSSGSGWASSMSPDNLVHPTVMDQIEGCANYLDGKVFVYEHDDSEALDSLVSRARVALNGDPDLDPQLHYYIHRLLQEIEIALSDESAGIAFDYTAAVQRLWVAMRAAEGASTDDDSKRRWRDAWQSILTGTVSGGLVQAGALMFQITAAV
ncbi:hypothetical protein [Paramicrobacterium chengjingii]|uniref:Uncharacterized protein n=1 Tax=Paramicrobacterium chengjingii TaxID=2769067 RepID=A0ABX6YLN9_9MICO|nr:hypothetical protein [Microbacterium chengjingii]QPZ39712.1 hypothetical protein HCR76_06615 [Microbacterium chengjingii]